VNHQCLNCAEELAPNPPWWTCNACGRAYLEADLVRITQRQQRERERQEIMDILAEQNRRRSNKSSSNSAATKDDKLPTRKQRQLEWTEKDRERYLVAQTKIESKTEFLSVRGLPEDVTADEVLNAIQEELMPDLAD